MHQLEDKVKYGEKCPKGSVQYSFLMLYFDQIGLTQVGSLNFEKLHPIFYYNRLQNTSKLILIYKHIFSF